MATKIVIEDLPDQSSPQVIIEDNPDYSFLEETGTVAPTADEVRSLLKDPSFLPTKEEFKILQQDDQSKSLSQKAEALGSGVVQGVKGISQTIGGAVEEVYNDPSILIRPGDLTQTALEASTRGTYDLLTIAAKLANNPLTQSISDKVQGKSEEQILDDAYSRFLDIRAIEQVRQEGLNGDRMLAPQITGQANEKLAEAGSLVMDPTMVIPGVGLGKAAIKGVATQTAKATAKVLEATGHIVKTSIDNTVSATGKVLSKAVPFLGEPKTAGAIAATAAAVGIPGALPLGAKVAGTRVAAAGVEKTGQAVTAISEVAAKPASQFGTFEQLAKDSTKPEWMRRSAKTLSKIDAPLAVAGNTALGAAQGAAIGAGIALGSGEDAEGIGKAIGSGGFLGGIGSLVNQAAMAPKRRFEAENNDIVSFLAANESLGGNSQKLSKLSRDTQLQAATTQKIFGDELDIIFLDDSAYKSKVKEASGSEANGEAGSFLYGAGPGRKQSVLVNLEAKRAPGDTFLHEVGHALWKSPAIDKTNAKLLMREIYGEAGLQNLEKQYAEKLLKAQGKDASDTAVNDQIQALRDDYIKGDPTADNLSWIEAEVFSEQFLDATSGENLNKLRKGGSNIDRAKETVLEAKASLLSKIGIPLDKAGKVDQGATNALFDSTALKNDTRIKEVVKNYIKERDQWKKGVDESKEPEGVKIEPGKENKNLAEHPAIQWEENKTTGTAETDFAIKDKDGKVTLKDPKAIKKIEEERIQEIRSLVDNNITLQPGEIGFGKRLDGTIGGTKLPDNFEKLTRFSDATKQAARELEEAGGNTFNMWYQQVGSGADTLWYKSVKQFLGNFRGSEREVKFLGWKLSKKDNLTATVLDVGASRRKMVDYYDKGKLNDLWGGDLSKFQEDLFKYMENHSQDLPGDANGIGGAKKDFLNAFFGADNKANAQYNPLRATMKGKSLVKSFRLDRMQNVKASGRSGWFFDYNKQLRNLSPEIETQP